MQRDKISSLMFIRRIGLFLWSAMMDDVSMMSFRSVSRPWWHDVQALDRRPLIRGLAASGAVRA